MLRPALILATALAISSTAQAAWKNPLGKEARQARSAARAANKPDEARDTAFASLQSEHARIMTASRTMVSAATLRTSPQLKWTRDVLDRPRSDWGPHGAGEPFREKRSALLNLRWANGNAGVVRGRLAQFEGAYSLSRAQRRWVSSARVEVDQLVLDADNARRELRGTETIWDHQGEVLVWGAKPGQIRPIRAMLTDGPHDQADIEAHLDEYEASRR